MARNPQCAAAPSKVDTRSNVLLSRAIQYLRTLTDADLRRSRRPPGPFLVRRAETLIIVPERTETVVFNYATNEVVKYTRRVANVLGSAHQWTSPHHLVKVAGGSRRGATSLVVSLINAGLLVVKGTTSANRDLEYERDWMWDVRAGLFHLALRNPLLQSDSDAAAEFVARVASVPQPPLFDTNAGRDEILKLPKATATGALSGVLSKRRTRRRFEDVEISRRALADCLHAGLGITGFMVKTAPGVGPLPLKLTPSGGARNPYEAFVYARRVRDVPPGIYHYSAAEHSLGLVTRPPLPRPSELVGDQLWADQCATIILLVANYQRTMAKYPHPNAYRVVLIEAGHIGQNVMLAAGAHGLTANPTALFRDALIEQHLGIRSVVQGVNYAILIGKPSAKRIEPGHVIRNDGIEVERFHHSRSRIRSPGRSPDV